MALQVQVDQLTQQAAQLQGFLLAKEQEAATRQQQAATVAKEAVLIELTSAALKVLLEKVSAESLTDVERLVTYGLRTVFDDRSLSLKMSVTQKRSLQWVDLRLFNGTVEGDILDNFGGGPATVVAFLLRILVVQRMHLAPLLLLDESFSHVSERYLPAVAKLLRQICDQLGMTIVLVTHQGGPEFIEHATRAYEAVETSNGTVFKELEAH